MGTGGLGQRMNVADSFGLNNEVYALALAIGFLGIGDPPRSLRARAARPALASLPAEHGVREQQRTYKALKIAAEIAVPIAILAAWQLWTVQAENPNFPRLSTIMVEFQDLWLFSQFGTHVVPSLMRILLGFGIAVGRRSRARDPARHVPLDAGAGHAARRVLAGDAAAGAAADLDRPPPRRSATCRRCRSSRSSASSRSS